MRNTHRQRIVTLLTSEYPTRLTADQIAGRLGAPEPSIRRTVAQMEMDAEVFAYPRHGGRLEYSVRGPVTTAAIENASLALGGDSLPPTLPEVPDYAQR